MFHFLMTREVATHIARYIAKKLNSKFENYCKEFCIDDLPTYQKELKYINTLTHHTIPSLSLIEYIFDGFLLY